MSCNLAAGITLGCRDNAGGVNKVWITDYDNIATVTKTTGDTITAISGTGTFYSFELIRTTSEMTETINASLENGTTYYTQELTMFFAKLEQYKRNIIKTLAQSFRLAVIFEDNNGSYFLLGEEYGMFVSAGSNVTGLALGDRQGYNLTLQALEQLPMNELSGPIASVVQGMTVQS
jgi:hypothetical protein